MKCEAVRDELVAFARRELAAEVATKVEEHLARCEGCTRELESAREVLAITLMADDESIVAAVTALLEEAIDARASDLHLDATDAGGEVRRRIDGVLLPVRTLTREAFAAHVARLKRLAGMSVSERKAPQDGGIPLERGGRSFHLRVSVFPFFHGENACIRILDRANLKVDIDRIGLAPVMRERIETALAQPNGLIIVAGPSSSGKTYTAYALLSQVTKPEVKTICIEDPVELLLPGVSQASIDPRSGLTYAAAIRAFMRQDPDILMVGDISDGETLVACLEAAMSGHLVIAVMQAWGAISALTRLRNLGADPSQIASALKCVLGQRLSRLLCPACRRPETPSDADLRALGFTPDAGAAGFHGPVGCEKCQGKGYARRIGLYELLTVDQEFARRIAADAPAAELRSIALDRGVLISFRDDARPKVADGSTSVAEALRVLEAIDA